MRASSSVGHTPPLSSDTANTQPAVPKGDESALHPLLHSKHYPLRTAPTTTPCPALNSHHYPLRTALNTTRCLALTLSHTCTTTLATPAATTHMNNGTTTTTTTTSTQNTTTATSHRKLVGTLNGTHTPQENHHTTNKGHMNPIIQHPKPMLPTS